MSLSINKTGPIANKTGKITTTATKAAHIVNGMTDRGIIGAAFNGKGAIGKQARASIKGVLTLDTLLTLDAVDGGQWADIFGLLVQEFGVIPSESIIKTAAKPRCAAYCVQVQKNLDAKLFNADTVKQQQTVQRVALRLDVVAQKIGELIESAAAAAAAAAATAAAAAAAAADTTTTTTTKKAVKAVKA